jgi:hypothetical protein
VYFEIRKEMKRKHEDLDPLPLLPDEIIVEILEYLPYAGKNWLNCRLVNKTFLRLSKIAHNPALSKRKDPPVPNNYAIYWAVEHGYKNVLNELMQDKRTDPAMMWNLPIRTAAQRGDIL